MKIFLVPIGNPRSCEGMKELLLCSEPRLHDLCHDPEAADLILVVGHWDRTQGQKPGALTSHPVIRKYPEKCFAYSEDDRYLPLLPGVYTSAGNTLSAQLRRVRNYCYISRWRSERKHLVAWRERPRKLLFSFMGAATSEVRTRLYKTAFNRSDILVEDTSHYGHYGTESASEQHASQARYSQILAESHFVLCPRGGGLGSMRFFEAMEAGRCPVLIADGFLLPEGPDWAPFLVSIPESRISELEQILAPLEASSERRGRLAHDAWRTWFAPEVAANRIVSHCVEIQKETRTKERYFRLLWPWMKSTHFAYYGSKKLWKLLRLRSM